MIAQISAFDEDSGVNSALSYHIIAVGETAFSINATTGSLHLNSSLDREVQDSYTVSRPQCVAWLRLSLCMLPSPGLGGGDGWGLSLS